MNLTGVVLHSFTLLFTGLKLAHVIDWSWGWVTLPSWGPVVFGLLLFVIGHTLLWLVRRQMTPEERTRAEVADVLEAYVDALEQKRK